MLSLASDLCYLGSYGVVLSFERFPAPRLVSEPVGSGRTWRMADKLTRVSVPRQA
jgi:hypothetical protein